MFRLIFVHIEADFRISLYCFKHQMSTNSVLLPMLKLCEFVYLCWSGDFQFLSKFYLKYYLVKCGGN